MFIIFSEINKKGLAHGSSLYSKHIGNPMSYNIFINWQSSTDDSQFNVKICAQWQHPFIYLWAPIRTWPLVFLWGNIKIHLHRALLASKLPTWSRCCDVAVGHKYSSRHLELSSESVCIETENILSLKKEIMETSNLLSVGALFLFMAPVCLSVPLWDRASLACASIPGKQ